MAEVELSSFESRAAVLYNILEASLTTQRRRLLFIAAQLQNRPRLGADVPTSFIERLESAADRPTKDNQKCGYFRNVLTPADLITCQAQEEAYQEMPLMGGSLLVNQVFYTLGNRITDVLSHNLYSTTKACRLLEKQAAAAYSLFTQNTSGLPANVYLDIADTYLRVAADFVPERRSAVPAKRLERMSYWLRHEAPAESGALAEEIYTEGYRVGPMFSILGDMLIDVSCPFPEVVEHLQNPSVFHVRGCWALDMILGRY